MILKTTSQYNWANGVYYEGGWNNGLREGTGKMVYPASTVTGEWKEDRYMGKKLLAPYKVISSLSVARYSITKNPEKSDRVKIRLMQSGQDNVQLKISVWPRTAELNTGAAIIMVLKMLHTL